MYTKCSSHNIFKETNIQDFLNIYRVRKYFFIISYKYSLIVKTIFMKPTKLVNTTFLMHLAKPTTLCSEKVIDQNLILTKILIHRNHRCKIWSNALINSINLENTNISKYSINYSPSAWISNCSNLWNSKLYCLSHTQTHLWRSWSFLVTEPYGVQTQQLV